MVTTKILKAQFGNFQKAVNRLNDALSYEKTEMNRDATIQRFEFCFELSWKLLKTANLALGI